MSGKNLDKKGKTMKTFKKYGLGIEYDYESSNPNSLGIILLIDRQCGVSFILGKLVVRAGYIALHTKD